MRQGAQQQRCGQPALDLQVLDEPLHVGGPAGLIDQVDGRPLARADSDLHRRLGRQGMVVDQVVADLIGHHVDQPFGHRRRERLAIGHGSQQLLRVGEAGDGLLQAVLGEAGVVVGAGGPHRRLRPMLDQGGGHRLGQADAGGDGDLANWPGVADDLDEVLVGERGRGAEDRGGHRFDVTGQLQGHVAGHHGRSLQRHRQGPAHQLCGVGGHDPQDLVGNLAFLFGEDGLVDAATELVGRGGPLVDGGSAHQALDVALRQRGARGRHRAQSPAPAEHRPHAMIWN